MKNSYHSIILFLSLIALPAKSQTATAKNFPFTEKSVKMSEAVTVRYESEAPAVYSNPTNQTQIAFENKNQETVNLYLYNTKNKEVQVMYSKSKNGIQETFTIYTSQIPAGTYNCKIEAGSTVVTRKLIVNR